ncbi:MAG: 4'-phosphopantetheinyl transferase superfamily protein [Bacteroidota bacterium]
MLLHCQIYYTQIDQPFSEERVRAILRYFPAHLKKRVLQYKDEWAKSLSVAGKLLLLYGLKQIGYKNIFNQLLYTSNGRPFLQNTTLDFNISHSHRLVVCAIVKNYKVGVDIQKIVPIKQKFERFFLHPKEMNLMDNREKVAIWVKKEAISKVEGDGLGISFTEIYCPENTYVHGGKRYFIHPIHIHSAYIGYIVFNSSPVKTYLKQVPEKVLIQSMNSSLVYS